MWARIRTIRRKVDIASSILNSVSIHLLRTKNSKQIIRGYLDGKIVIRLRRTLLQVLLKILRAHRTTSEINSLLIENRTSKRYVDYSSGDTPLPVLEPVKVWLYPRRIQRHRGATLRCVRGSTCNASSRVRKSISGLLDLRTSKYATGNSILLENLSKHLKRNTMLGSQPQPDMLSILLSGNEKTLKDS